MFEQIGVAIVPPFHLQFLSFLFDHQFLQDFKPFLVLLLGLPVQMAQILGDGHLGNCLITRQFLLKKQPLMVPPLPYVLYLMFDIYIPQKSTLYDKFGLHHRVQILIAACLQALELLLGVKTGLVPAAEQATNGMRLEHLSKTIFKLYIQTQDYINIIMLSSGSQDKPRRVLGFYEIVKKLGEGAFGEIYLGKNVKDGSEVALKIESASVKRSQLLLQSKFIIDLAKSKQIGQEINIPNVFNIGKEGNCYVMVMDLLGNSLEDLLNLCDRHFSLKTTIMIGLEMLKLIRFVHSRGVLHRDLKPDNFLIGRRQNIGKIYMIDFGLAKRFLGKEKEHIAYRDNKDLTGTARYASINTHLGIEQGRRDDLESLMYVLLYFLRGSLPWQSMKGQGKKQKYDKIMQKKLTIEIPTLCEGLPLEFQEIISYIRGLHFNSDPDYGYIEGKLRAMAGREGYDLEVKDYDWIQVVKKKIAEKQRHSQANIGMAG